MTYLPLRDVILFLHCSGTNLSVQSCVFQVVVFTCFPRLLFTLWMDVTLFLHCFSTYINLPMRSCDRVFMCCASQVSKWWRLLVFSLLFFARDPARKPFNSENRSYNVTIKQLNENRAIAMTIIKARSLKKYYEQH